MFIKKSFIVVLSLAFSTIGCQKESDGNKSQNYDKKAACSVKCGGGKSCTIDNGKKCYCDWLGNPVCEAAEDVQTDPNVSSGSGTIKNFNELKANCDLVSNPSSDELKSEIQNLIDLFGSDNRDLTESEVEEYQIIIAQIQALKSDFSANERFIILNGK